LENNHVGPKRKEIKMRNAILFTMMGVGLAVGGAHGEQLSKNPEVAEFQKLEQLVGDQQRAAVCSEEHLLKARILAARALYGNRELPQDQWLAKEQELNVALLKLQAAELSQRKTTVDAIFEFQNWLLSTRELLKKTTGTNKPSKGNGK
jgi:hypothetical protein